MLCLLAHLCNAIHFFVKIYSLRLRPAAVKQNRFLFLAEQANPDAGQSPGSNIALAGAPTAVLVAVPITVVAGRCCEDGVMQCTWEPGCGPRNVLGDGCVLAYFYMHITAHIFLSTYFCWTAYGCKEGWSDVRVSAKMSRTT